MSTPTHVYEQPDSLRCAGRPRTPRGPWAKKSRALTSYI